MLQCCSLTREVIIENGKDRINALKHKLAVYGLNSTNCYVQFELNNVLKWLDFVVNI